MDIDILHTANDSGLQKRQKQTAMVVNLGLLANAVLAAVKLTAGIIGHSQALLADGINSISDVVYFMVVKVLVRLSGKPADEEHPYGHFQFESIAALVVGAFVITTGIAIFWDSVNAAYDLLTSHGSHQPVRAFALYVALGTVVIKCILMLQARAISAATRNLAVQALARDHRNDIFASLGAATGILLGLLGVRWFDPLAGALVAIIVMKTGFDILRESSAELMDSVPSRAIEKQVREILAGFSEVQTVECIHAHRFGPYLTLNVTIGIDGTLSVARGDRIADSVEVHLCKEIDLLRRVYVHYHPAHLQEATGARSD